jgi:serine/threonine protein kinase
LGAGTYGSVFKGVNLETNETRAIKAILKSKVKNQERFKIEIDIMRKLVTKKKKKIF